ncbi:helix-turn-helix transcriptional regulator, partial [Silanimonas sp.]|uniref:helix-turn-helix transcriptional regulator n=1 Tax=Silanimonas sp. TaxID=1929290 RepID=UPI001BC29076
MAVLSRWLPVCLQSKNVRLNVQKQTTGAKRHGIPDMPGAIFNTKAMGEALRAERAALGMTQAKLAAAAGVPRQRISEIERGENVT